MTKRMLISVDRDESRAAVVEDGQLVHLEIEPVNRNTCKGNIYRAVVARVEQSLQSAFVDFGNEKQGFMPVGEIHPKLRGGNHDRRAPIQDILRAKTEILVQVVRDEIGQKGATLSTFVSLPGRYLVLIPESEKTGVSRKLSEEARDRIKALTEKMQIPEGFGLIVRTAGETATERELEKDLLYLSRQWAHITKRFEESKGPTLLYAERSLPVRFVRDYFTRDIDEVVIDDDATLHEVGEFLQVLMPRGLAAMHRYVGDVPLFARYGVEGKVEDVFSRQVFMQGGGSIVIDQTEALVSIDVNSGRQKEKDIEETARATNIEAAQEIARQMILRDMGGLIVIDFIDMREKKYVREVEQALKDAFKNDKARTKIAHISEFGLLEMSRQRIKSSVNKGAFDSCPHCSGTGRIRAMESVGMAILRRIYELVAQKKVRYVIAMIPPQAARYLLNSRRAELAAIEKQYHMTIEVVPVDGMPATQVVMEHLEEIPEESGTERSDKHKLLRVTQELDLVRNQLIRREEARIQLDAAVSKRGAKVDYAEIYREVREMTPTASTPEEEPRAPRQRQRGQGHGAGGPAQAEGAVSARVASPVVPAHPVVEPEWEDLPQQRGFWHSIKSLFGMAPEPQPVQVTRPPVQAPLAALPSTAQTTAAQATAAKVNLAPAQPQGGASGAQSEPPRGDRRDRHDRHERRERRDSNEPRDGQHARDGQAPREGREPRDGRRRPEGAPQQMERGEQATGRSEQAPRGERDQAARGEPSRGELAPKEATDKHLIAGATEGTAEESAEAAGRRRRRRRRRGGARGADDVQGLAGDDLAADGTDSEGDDGEQTAEDGAPAQAAAEPRDETRRARPARGGRGEDSGRSRPVEAAGDAQIGEVAAEAPGAEAQAGEAVGAETAESDADAHRRRRRRGGRADRSPESTVDLATGVAHEASAAETMASEAPVSEAPVSEVMASEATASEATSAPAQAEGGHAEPVAVEAVQVVAQPAVEAVEVAVDAQSLVQAEIERLKSEQEPEAVQPAADTEAAAPADAARPAATKRFVVDLRTGR